MMELLESARGQKLSYENYVYTKKKASKSTIWWICSQRTSKACNGFAHDWFRPQWWTKPARTTPARVGTTASNILCGIQTRSKSVAEFLNSVGHCIRVHVWTCYFVIVWNSAIIYILVYSLFAGCKVFFVWNCLVCYRCAIVCVSIYAYHWANRFYYKVTIIIIIINT